MNKKPPSSSTSTTTDLAYDETLEVSLSEQPTLQAPSPSFASQASPLEKGKPLLPASHELSSPPQLKDSSLTVARCCWIVYASLSLLLFLVYLFYAVPLVWQLSRNLSLSSLGPSFEKILEFFRALLVYPLFAGLALFLWLRHPREKMVFLFTASTLSLGCIPFTIPVLIRQFQIPWGHWEFLALFFVTSSLPLTALLAMLYPNGRFYPRWTPYLLPLFLLLGFLYGAWAYLYHQLSFSLFLTIFLACLLLLFFQFLRYRQVPPIQRYQIKWFAFAGALFFVPQTLLILFLHLSFLPQHPSLLLLQKIFFQIFSVLSFVLPIFVIALSIARYRLWNIDLAINRSLVYSALLFALGLIFVGAFFSLRHLSLLLLNQQQEALALILPTALVVGLFRPVQKKIQRFVTQHFYGIGLDYQTVARSLSSPLISASNEEALFGGYQALDLLGSGGMGEVYRSKHPLDGYPVALKLLHHHSTHNAMMQRRFLREAQIVSQLQHPHIVQIYDFGEQRGLYYMAMEYIEGDDLANLLQKRGRLPLEEILPWLQEIAAALDYAHQQGVIHRDIKPSNIMLEYPQEDPQQVKRAVLMDFGVAHLLNAETQLTQSGYLLGTLDYIAPEQIKAASAVDQRADIYSLGVVVFQLLTGHLPFLRDNSFSLLLAHMMQPPPNPQLWAPELPPPSAAAILQALAKQPQDRFASATSFVRALAPTV